MRQLLKKEKGAVAIVEAAIVYPIVIIIVAFVLYLGMYLMQNAILMSRAYEVASIASKCAAFPGYSNLGADVKNYDFNELPGSAEISSAMDDYTLLSDAYRYWKKTIGDSGELEKLEQSYKSLASAGGFLGGNVECDVQITRSGLSHYVTVTVDGAPEMPGMFKIIGLDKAVTYNLVAKAPVLDTSEFIRNTDLVVDFTKFLLEKFKVGEKFDVFFSRIKTCVNDIF